MFTAERLVLNRQRLGLVFEFIEPFGQITMAALYLALLQKRAQHLDSHFCRLLPTW